MEREFLFTNKATRSATIVVLFTFLLLLLIFKAIIQVKLYTRNYKDYSDQYSQVISIVMQCVQYHTCIIDGEMMAWDRLFVASFSFLLDLLFANLITLLISEVEDYIPFGSNRTVANLGKEESNKQWLSYIVRCKFFV